MYQWCIDMTNHSDYSDLRLSTGANIVSGQRQWRVTDRSILVLVIVSLVSIQCPAMVSILLHGHPGDQDRWHEDNDGGEVLANWFMLTLHIAAYCRLADSLHRSNDLSHHLAAHQILFDQTHFSISLLCRPIHSISIINSLFSSSMIFKFFISETYKKFDRDKKFAINIPRLENGR